MKKVEINLKLMYINVAKGKKKVIIRPESYALNRFSAGHLRMLLGRLEKFIEIMEPAFFKAEKNVSIVETKLNIIQRGSALQKFVSPSDLRGWLIHKKTELAEFVDKVEAGDRNLTDKPLNNIRQIRAYFSRFESIAKAEYGGVSMFESAEPQLANLLLQEFVPARNASGVFAVARFILRNEDFHSKDDLGKVRNELKVEKITQYLVKAHKALTIKKTVHDSVSQQSTPSLPAAIETRVQTWLTLS